MAWEPGETFWGRFLDDLRLDGHSWEIAHNPGWPLDDEGGIHVAG
jgi:hypothetical protein